WSQLPAASLAWPFYPHAYVMQDGKLLVAATTEAPAATKLLDLSTQSWSTVDSRLLDAYSSAMYLPGKILKTGTGTDADHTTGNSASTAYVLDMNQPTPQWRQIANMAFRRTYHVETILPDGNVLVTGGGGTVDPYDVANAVFQAELWSPTTEAFTTLSS